MRLMRCELAVVLGAALALLLGGWFFLSHPLLLFQLAVILPGLLVFTALAAWAASLCPADELAREMSLCARRRRALSRCAERVEALLAEGRPLRESPLAGEDARRRWEELESGLRRVRLLLARERAVMFSLGGVRWLRRADGLLDAGTPDGAGPEWLGRVAALHGEGVRILRRLELDPEAASHFPASAAGALVEGALEALEASRRNLVRRHPNRFAIPRAGRLPCANTCRTLDRLRAARRPRRPADPDAAGAGSPPPQA